MQKVWEMTGSILIIAGEPILRRQITSALTEAGFGVVDVPDYPEAILKLDEFKPDMVIMDAVLPGSDGVEVCYQLRSTFDIPIVLLGEDSSDEVWRRVMKSDADLYLVKPFSCLELVARVKAILCRVRQRGKISKEANRNDSLLTSEERANGLSIVVDEHHNTRLLVWGDTVAWFSSAVTTTEVLKGFLELIKARCISYVAPK